MTIQLHLENRGDSGDKWGQPVSMRVSGVPATGDSAGTSGDSGLVPERARNADSVCPHLSPLNLNKWGHLKAP